MGQSDARDQAVGHTDALASSIQRTAHLRGFAGSLLVQYRLWKSLGQTPGRLAAFLLIGPLNSSNTLIAVVASWSRAI